MARILIIDDEEAVRLTLRQILQHAGYDVVEAENGAVGLARMREKSADLVITDIIMPEMEGVETVTAMRKEFPAVKLIAMSGGGRTGNFNFLGAALKLGAAKVLQKPFNRVALLDAVRECLAPA
ncbi:MAG: response regulator [Pseudomonadota bacterium]